MTTNNLQPTVRAELLARLEKDIHYDLIVVGGGATGLGVALDAASRGLKVVLLEAQDFAKGTSSRATKLVHGGVRYLAQGNVSLVREALHERKVLLQNAPHLAQPLAFVVPAYQRWQQWFYGLGLTAYDLLAGKSGLGKTRFLSAQTTAHSLPGVRQAGLKGGVQYWDGQFDDARLALALARTAAREGALVINYCKVQSLVYADHKVAGVVCEDSLGGGMQYTVRGRCVVNATGVWVDALREQDALQQGERPSPMVAPSQGVHLVVDKEFLGGDAALMIPKTEDGRVLFAVPWLGKVILGTTDTPRADLPSEPDAFEEEVAFILREAGRYLVRAPRRADVRSIWVGLRPLVKPQGDTEATKKISREHTVLVSKAGLVTVTGGKWTTYRAMAEDVLRVCAEKRLIGDVPASRTAALRLVGAPQQVQPLVRLSQGQGLHIYGEDAAVVQSLPGADNWLAPGLSEAMVRFAARYEYANTVEDVLARRSRLLFLDAAQAANAAPAVAGILAAEVNPMWVKCNEFAQLAKNYCLNA